MSERISIAGKGKELFFGEDEQAEGSPKANAQGVVGTQPTDDSGTPPSEPANSPAQEPARQPASEQASSPSSQIAGSQHKATNDTPDPGDDGRRRRLRELVFRDHPKHGGYRFAQDELDALRDVAYELEVRRGINVTKNDIVRLSLNHLIEDYRHNPDDSLLVEIFREQGKGLQRR